MGFVLGFTDRFLAALGMWPLASLLLTLPILAYLYHRDGRLRPWSAVGAYLVVLYFLGLGCFTLYPMPTGDSGLGITYGIAPQLDPLAFVGDVSRDGAAAVLQIAMNVVLFMPLGFVARRALGMPRAATVMLGLLLSLLVETAQLTGFFWLYPYAYRTFDVCDLMWNASGALLGWQEASLLERMLPPAPRDGSSVTREPGFLHRCVAFALDMLLVWTASLTAWSLAIAILPAAASQRFAEGSDAGWIVAAAFVAVEFVAPLLRAGQTPGGAFVRMTCETRERGPVHRACFLAIRAATIYAALTGFPPAVPALCLFYLFARKMPYDFV